jgi:uncharacterized membrane protein YfcA
VPTLPVTPDHLVIALVMVTIASAIQGAIGFGLAVISAPLLLMLDPIFLPGPMLIAGMLLTMLVAFRDRDHAVWPEVAVGSVGRSVGTLPAAIALRLMSAEAYDMLFAVAVLAGVGISVVGWRMRLTLRNVFLTAVGSGFISTVSAVGGPPMALVYQHETGPRMRGTLSAMFTIGTIVSVIGLWWAGKFGQAELVLGLLLLPAVVVGFGLSGILAGKLDEGHTRPAILILASLAALIILFRSLAAHL